MICAATEFLSSRGCINITTPKIVAAATEGGTELFPIAYFEKEAFLNQSPQLYKQMMMAAGFEAVFEIGPIFRAEEHNTIRHLNEATSLDIEISFADHNDVMELLEELIVHIYGSVAKNCADDLAEIGVDLAIPERPFPRIPYLEAIEIANQSIEEKISFGDDLTPAAERAIGDTMGGHYFIVDWPTDGTCLRRPAYPRSRPSGGADPRKGAITREFRVLPEDVPIRYAAACRVGAWHRASGDDDARSAKHS